MKMELDNGKISTILITLVGVILTVVIANPTILQAVMGEYYIQYGAAILAILIAIYNAYYPRQNNETEIEEIETLEKGA